jgi:hypothetical protein
VLEETGKENEGPLADQAEGTEEVVALPTRRFSDDPISAVFFAAKDDVERDYACVDRGSASGSHSAVMPVV